MNIKSTLRLHTKGMLGLLAITWLFLAHYFQQNIGGDGLRLPFNVIFLLGAYLVCLAVLLRSVFTERLFLTRYNLLMLVLTGLILLPATYTYQQFLHLNIFKFYFICSLPFVLILFSQMAKRHTTFILGLLLGAVFIQQLWGITQMYIVGDNNFMGYIRAVGKPYGVFQQTNVYGVFMAFGGVLAGYTLVMKQFQCRYMHYFAYLVAFLSGFLTPMTDSRMALVALAISMVLFVVHALVTKRKQIYGVILALFVGTMVQPLVSFVVPNALEEGNISILTANKKFERAGTRATIMPTTFNMIKDNPFQGYGFGSFDKRYLEYQAKYIESHPDARWEIGTDHPHNEILMWWVEGGLLSFLALVAMGLATLWMTLRQGFVHGFPKLILISPFVVHSMLEYPFYHSFVHLGVFLLLLALFDTTKTMRLKITKYGAGIAFAGAAVLYVFYADLAQRVLLQSEHFVVYKTRGEANPDILAGAPRTVFHEERLQHEIMRHRLVQALGEEPVDPEKLVDYIKWGYSFTQHRPVPAVYHNMINGLIMIGRKQGAEIIWNDAMNLYPMDDDLVGYAEQFGFTRKVGKSEEQQANE